MNGFLLLGLIVTILIIMFIKKEKDQPSYDTYVIKKGKHYSKRNGSIFNWKISLTGETLKFRVIFSDGCNYNEEGLGGDINKLYGISYGFDNHYRSVRVGWKYNSNLGVIEIYSYAYGKGKRYIKKLFYTALYDETEFVIKRDSSNSVSITAFNGKNHYIDIIKDIDKSWIRFKQWPYFGGDKPAPEKMKIFIREEKIKV
jgi:hypothetical protein